MPKKIFRQAKKLLPLIGISIFVYLIYKLGVEDIVHAILSIPLIYIILAILLTIPALVIRNYAWYLILREQKIKVGFLRSLKILFIGYFYGVITPSYLGLLMRVPYLKEKTGEPYGKLFMNSSIDSLVHTVSLYGMMFVGSLLIMGTMPNLFYITSAWVLCLSIILIYFIKKERGEKLLFFLIKYFTPKKIRKYLTDFVGTFYIDFPKIRKLLIPFLVGISTWVIVFSQGYLIVLGLGLSIPYLYYLILYPIVNVSSFVPITFAGLGVRELTSIFLFSTLYGLSAQDVFAFTLIVFIIGDVFPGLIGFILSLTEAKKGEMKDRKSVV